MIFADTPTLGVLIGWPVAILVLLGCAVVGVLAFRDRDRGGYSDSMFAFWGAVGIAVVTLAVFVFTSWPFKHDYHTWQPVSGTVTKVSKRLVPAGDKSMEEKFVFVIDGKPYGVTDTRAALVEAGEKVSLRCKKAYQWGVPYDAHGWDCRWSS